MKCVQGSKGYGTASLCKVFLYNEQTMKYLIKY